MGRDVAVGDAGVAQRKKVSCLPVRGVQDTFNGRICIDCLAVKRPVWSESTADAECYFFFLRLSKYIIPAVQRRAQKSAQSAPFID